MRCCKGSTASSVAIVRWSIERPFHLSLAMIEGGCPKQQWGWLPWHTNARGDMQKARSIASRKRIFYRYTLPQIVFTLCLQCTPYHSFIPLPHGAPPSPSQIPGYQLRIPPYEQAYTNMAACKVLVIVGTLCLLPSTRSAVLCDEEDSTSCSIKVRQLVNADAQDVATCWNREDNSMGKSNLVAKLKTHSIRWTV